MTAIIRVKRHRGEDPMEALVLSCKRKKTTDAETSENQDSNFFKCILNFSGTVEDKDNKIAATTVESFRKDFKHSELKSKEHVPDIKMKQRKDWKERSEENRFTLLSCLRSSNSFANEDNSDNNVKDPQKKITIVDVSKENDENLPAFNTTEDSFVYDLYSTNIEYDSDYNDIFMEHLLSVQPLHSELYYQNNEDSSDEINQDEDDSNDENNWRNEYPDSDIFEDEEDEDDGEILSRRLNKFHFVNDSYESTSESDNERYFNYDDDEKYCYHEAEDLAGKRYARYKANALKTMIENEEENGAEYEESDEECSAREN